MKKRGDHILYEKALRYLKNHQEEKFKLVIESLELTLTEKRLLTARLMMGQELWLDCRNLLVNMNPSESQFLNAERAMILGHAYSHLHNSDKARMAYLAALRDYRTINDRRGQLVCHIMLARNLLRTGFIPLALKQLKEAEIIAISQSEKIHVFKHLAQTFIQKGDFEQARICLEKVKLQAGHLSPQEEGDLKKFTQTIEAQLAPKNKAKEIINSLALKKPSRAH